MSQARYLLAILSFLVYQVNSAPIATTTTAQADIPTTTTPHTCTVSVPFRKTLLHDLGCIQDAFRQLTQEITSLTYSSHDYSALDQPDCGSLGNIPDVDTQPWEAFHLLKQNVELLETVDSSKLNVSYAEYTCRMKEVVLPSLEVTLTGMCDCPESECDAHPEAHSLPSVKNAMEYCILASTDTLLRNLVLMLSANKHVRFTQQELQCQVDFAARREISDLGDSVETLSKNLALKALQTGLPVECAFDSSALRGEESSLVCLQEFPEVLKNTSDHELQALGQQLENVLPSFQRVLEDKVSGSSNCSVDSQALATESKDCIAQYLSILYSSSRNELEALGKLDLTCSPQSEDDEVVSIQAYRRPAHRPQRPSAGSAAHQGNSPTQPPATARPTQASAAPSQSAGPTRPYSRGRHQPGRPS